MGVHIPQEVPAGAGPLGHGIRLALGGTAAAGAGGVDPVGHLAQGTLAVIRGLVALHLRQYQRQLLLRQGHPAALLAVHQGNRLAPVALAGEHPVTQLVVDLLLAEALLHHVLLHGGDGLLHGHAVEEAGVDHDGAVVLGHKGLLGDIAALDHLDDGQTELLGEFPVALVVTGHAHDDTGAVAHEDVVGHEHGQGLMGHGVHDLNTLQPHAGLFLVQLAALKVGLVSRLLLIRLHGVPVLDQGLPLLQHGVLGRDDHVSRTEQGVGTGGVHRHLVAHVGLERHLGAGRAADPVALLDLHALDEIHVLQIVDETLGVGGDLQHPLALLLADDFAAAALTHAVDHFLVGQHALAAGAPVHRHGGLIGQTVLEHLQEYPLGPLVVVGVGGVHAAIPVKAVAQHLQLAGEIGDIVFGHHSRMDMVLDGVVLRGQAEGVEANGEQHVVALHPLFAGDDVHGREGAGMAHMQALTGGIGELDESVELGALVAGDGGIGLGFFPIGLPFLFNGRKIVIHVASPCI